MGRPRCTQKSLGGHFEGTGLATSLEVRMGPSGYQGQQGGQWLMESGCTC